MSCTALDFILRGIFMYPAASTMEEFWTVPIIQHCYVICPKNIDVLFMPCVMDPSNGLHDRSFNEGSVCTYSL